MQVTAKFRRATRWAGVAALLGGLGLAAGSGAQADTAGTNGESIFTQIVLTGDHQPPGSITPPYGWVPPKCWLEPNSGFGIAQAYTPDGFQLYMQQLNILFHHTDEQDLQYQTNLIYYYGKNADPIVGITNPPYNKGIATAGKWYEIACSIDATFQDYENFKATLGTSNDYEEWFWFNDGAPPANVPIADPELLAEYAAANTLVTPDWPTMSPDKGAVQTVNLHTLITNAAGDNGFRAYQATATLATTGDSSTVTAVPDRVIFSSDGMSPSSVTCTFGADGSLSGNCELNWYKSTTGTYSLTESTYWTVTWDGHPGWVRYIGPFNQTYNNIRVQEIQTIVGGQ